MNKETVIAKCEMCNWHSEIVYDDDSADDMIFAWETLADRAYDHEDMHFSHIVELRRENAVS